MKEIKFLILQLIGIAFSTGGIFVLLVLDQLKFIPMSFMPGWFKIALFLCFLGAIVYLFYEINDNLKKYAEFEKVVQDFKK